jgi:HEPN domain-containing protein
VNRKIVQTLALERLSDAEALLNARKYSGAYYLAGYSIECALKACIARRVKRYDFPLKDAAKYYTHDLERLIDSADLRQKLKLEVKRSRPFADKWTLVKEWSEEARYQGHSRKEAQELLAAVAEARSGVLQWLRRRW